MGSRRPPWPTLRLPRRLSSPPSPSLSRTWPTTCSPPFRVTAKRLPITTFPSRPTLPPRPIRSRTTSPRARAATSPPLVISSRPSVTSPLLRPSHPLASASVPKYLHRFLWQDHQGRRLRLQGQRPCQRVHQRRRW